MDEEKNLLLKQALYTINTLRDKISDQSEAIAVVGMACRFPGGCDTPEKYWNLLESEKDSIIDIPKERWDVDDYYDPVHGTPGKMYIRQGSFLQKNIKEFDTKFFKISPAEANSMDPQQRQLLEVCWEAIEDSGNDPTELKGSKTGVYVGIASNCEYAMLSQNVNKINQYLGTGTSSSIASGRIAYSLGLNGPALSVDTACSSSLVTVLLAVDSLRKHECDMALAGGVSLILSPTVISTLCAMNALSESGKCTPFDAAGDGYGKGEGCGIVVLKRLSDAKRDGDRIYATICGGAMDNDGASSGLTVPNGNAQRAVLEAALNNCHLKPEDIDYIETHGTGTALGDPIEMRSINEVFGKDSASRKNPLYVGAVKGNIGHLEAASGIASVIKVALSLYHKQIAPIVNCETINPRIDFDVVPTHLPQKLISWEKHGEKQRIAGINAFGFNGTNAHLILSETEQVLEEQQEDTTFKTQILQISAKTESSLKMEMERYQNFLDSHKNISIKDICYTANTRRSKFLHRAVVIGNKSKDFSKRLKNLASDKENFHGALINESEDELVFTNKIDLVTLPKLVGVFSGEPDQIFRCFAQLHRSFAIVRKAFKECLDEFEKYVDSDILKTLESTRCGKLYQNQKNILLFAEQYSMMELMIYLNIKPEVVMGTGVGNYIACIYSQILDMSEAVRLFVKQLECQKEKDSTNQAITKALKDIITKDTFKKAKCRLIIESKAEALFGDMTKDIWVEQILSPSRFDDSMEYIYKEGYRYFIEIGTVLSSSLWMQESKDDESVVFSMLNKDSFEKTFLKELARLYCIGCDINWKNLYDHKQHQVESIPTYAFEKTTYWYSGGEDQDEASINDTYAEQFGKPLKAKELILPYKNQRQFQFIFTHGNFRALIDNSGIVHCGYYVEMLQHTLPQLVGDRPYSICYMEFLSAIMVQENDVKEVLLCYDCAEENKFKFSFYSKNKPDNKWNLNISGEVKIESSDNVKLDSFEAMKNETYNQNHTKKEVYDCLEGRGFYFGSTVKWVDDVNGVDNSLVHVDFRQPEITDGKIDYALTFHPGILDSCAQICNFLAPEKITGSKRYMISKLNGIVTYPVEHNQDLHTYIKRNQYNEQKDELSCEVYLVNANDQLVLMIQQVNLKVFDENKLIALEDMKSHSGDIQNGIDKDFIMHYSIKTKEEKLEFLTNYVKKILADELEIPVDEFDVDESLETLGIDSMSGLKFYNRVTKLLGVEVAYADMIQAGSCKGICHDIQRLLPGGNVFKIDVDTQEDEVQEENFDVEHWIYDYQKNPTAKIRIFCFPYGFGSADMYKEWKEMLGDQVEVCAIKIPGLDIERMSEKPPVDIDQLMDTIEKVISDSLLDLPCVSFGHSWGSLFAYRLAYKLSLNPKANFIKLFVSGYTSASLRNTSLWEILDQLALLGYDHIPDNYEIKQSGKQEQISQAFISAWGINSSEEEVLQGTKLTLPLIASAYRLIERYHYDSNEEFNIPITAFHGIDDYRLSLNDINAWQDVTKSEFRLYTMTGDHGFILKEQSQNRVIELLNKELAECIDAHE